MLEGRSADLFMVETFYDLDELVEAIEAVRRLEPAHRRPDDVRRAGRDCSPGFRRATPPTARPARRRGDRREPRGGPDGDVGSLRGRCATRALPRALPNIGLASLAGGRVIFPHATPDYFAEFAAHARDLGARHRSAAERLGGDRGGPNGGRGQRQPRARLVFEERELVVALGRPSARRAWRVPSARASGSCPFSSTPAREQRPGTDRGIAGARRLGRVGFVDINDNATARARMNSLMVSARIERESGLETIRT